jgi:hypothetical protein
MDRRRGFTLFQLLVVLAVLAILLGLLLPAVAKVRWAAARNQSFNNLRQLGLSLHNHAGVYDSKLPPGVDDHHFSASARLLPFLEQEDLYKLIDFDKSIDDKANADARKTMVRFFLSPHDPLQMVKAEWGATNYLFNDQVFYLNSKSILPATFANKGTSNTVVIGETLKGDGGKKATDVKRQHVLLKKDALKGLKDDAGVQDFKDGKNVASDRCASWMDGRFLQGTFNGRLVINDPRPDVSCEGAGGVSALRSLDGEIPVSLADGSVRTITKDMAHKTWKWALDPDAKGDAPADW